MWGGSGKFVQSLQRLCKPQIVAKWRAYLKKYIWNFNLKTKQETIEELEKKPNTLVHDIPQYKDIGIANNS